jgi:enoyl-CoA hydratase/carnithine racemase
MPTSLLSLTFDGLSATLWLNRPEKQNAMTYEMWAVLPEFLARVEQSDARVLVIRGSGEHFCAGADIASLGVSLADAGTPHGYRAVNSAAEEALAAFQRPTVAVIDGNCIGGGCQIAVACDMRIASTRSRFGITPAKLGITYPTNSILRTADLLGTGATKRLLFTADIVDAHEAFRIGLVDVLVDDSDLESQAANIVTTLAERSLVTQLSTKALLRARITHSQEMNAVVGAWEATARESEDLTEGIAAFSERRKPDFQWLPGSEPSS